MFIVYFEMLSPHLPTAISESKENLSRYINPYPANVENMVSF